MRVPRSFSRSLLNVFSLLLVYALTISLFSPFSIRRVEAAPAGKPQPEPAAAKEEKKGGRRDGELLVRFRQGVSEQDKTRLVEGKGMTRGKRLRGRSRLEKLTLKPGQDLDSTLADLRQNSAVELAEPNYLVSRDEVTPNDPSFSEQWALKNTGATGGQPNADIQAIAAWDTTTGAQTTVIAVIDSGIDFTHPDLQNNQWTNTAESADGSDNDNNGLADDLHGWDWVTNSGAVADEHGHGTMVAGVIAAEGNNGAGTTGVMWRAALMSLRVLDGTGTGDVADAVEAIDYAVNHGAQVINCSWGTDQKSLALKEAIQRAGTKGVVVVSSAGNSGRDIEAAPYYPSSFGLSNQVSVASTDNFDRLAAWSNYGGTHVTIAAPGVDILTTKMGGGYTSFTGTSASTALVTGVAGLIKTKRWWLTAAGTRAAIIDGVRSVAELTGKVSSGGVISASGALAAMQEPGPEPDPTITPTPSTGGGSGETPAVPGEDSAGPDMPDLNAERDHVPADPAPPSRIHSDDVLPCIDCDPCAGSCGGEIATDPDFSTARLEPKNETGQPGVTLGSRNFNWGIPLVSLPGRSGLDLNLALTYNSLVWTKQGTSIKFDADRGQPTAGFRVGFPTIQQRFFDALANTYAYVMVTPSGGHVELRQVGTSNTYESADGSYMRMTTNGAGGAVVRTSDGTVLTFSPSVNNEMRCTEIKDRNGNFISVTYNATGRVAEVTDTLARKVTFNYDTSNYLTSISQTRGGATYYWATFSYGSKTIQTSFSGLSVVGPQNGTAIGVLNQVLLPDGTSYNFDYTSWGQVYKIRKVAADKTTLLAYTGYNLPGSQWVTTSAQTDCPRFTNRRDWALNWTGVNGLPTEAITKYEVDPAGAWAKTTTPLNVTYKELYAVGGWENGLTAGTEVWVCNTPACDSERRVKWTTTEWTQDDTTLTYQKNPRPTIMTVQDEDQNKRKTKIDYYPATSYGLPKDVFEYEVNATSGAETLLRKTHTDYDLSATYVDDTAGRRIIGLVSLQTVYDGANNLASKVEYQYDEGGAFFDASEGTPSQQHDSTNFGTDDIAGRGNRTSVRRWDVQAPADSTKVSESNTGYNAAGSVVLSRDALGHSVTIKYADNFSVAQTVKTLAYPKTVTDPDGLVSTAEYNYDTGAVTKASSPTSGTAATVIKYVDVIYTYDSVGRLSKVTNLNNGAYTRWVYPTTNLLVEQYETVSGTAEAYSAKVLDGAGRVRAVSADHTFSGTTTSTYSGQVFKYDIMGRPWKQSNPTEFTPNATTNVWDAAGDDAPFGWQYTTQTYDWKGRPLVTTNSDTTTRTNTYSGCGCAGGEQVTTTDERGRKKVFKKDTLGRLKTVEEYAYGGTVYSTTSYSYDALDHLTQIDQGGQLRKFEYDGHGRLSKRTTPEQGETNYLYNKDDTVQSVTDARTVTTTFAYNARHLPTAVSFTLPTGGGGVVATPRVTFAYDAAGNRTLMEEKNTAGTVVGRSTYNYDELGRMDWEERLLQGIGTYRLSYEYNLAGQLTKLTRPGQSGVVAVEYSYDKVGRTTAVTGSGYANVTSYVNSIDYRAFGAAREIAYGDTTKLVTAFDTRLRLTKWDVPGVLGWTYAYSATNIPEKTGRVAFANNLYDATLDRSYKYDEVGRLIEAHSGNEANADAGYIAPLGTNDTRTGAHSAAYRYDQFGNMTERYGWGVPGAQYSRDPQFNAKNQMTVNPVAVDPVTQAPLPMTYDAAGNLTSDGEQSFTYNAQGQQATASGMNLSQSYDGDGLRVKKTESGVTTAYLRSSVLGGQVVVEIGGTSPNMGQMLRGYVYLGGQMVAIQESNRVNGAGDQVLWVHQDPVTKSQRLTDKDGVVVSWVDLDPWGGETSGQATSSSVNASVWRQPHRFTTYERDGNGGDEAMFRRYESKLPRFSQPDPYDGSYDLADPQSLNRYSYTQNDPVNFTDPLGLEECTEFDKNGACISRTSFDQVIDDLAREPGRPGGFITSSFIMRPLVQIGPNIPDARQTGPCLGYKGAELKYDEPRKFPDDDGATTAREHITNRHINQLPRHRGKSDYEFDSFVASSLEFKQAAVGSLNAVTFIVGDGQKQVTKSGLVRYKFTLDFNKYSAYTVPPGMPVYVGRWSPAPGLPKIPVGVNTVIVESDCQTVVTSHPGP
jgi:RHS repeat-associated protein